MGGETRVVEGSSELGPGSVLAGRFEIREQLAADGFGDRFAALDRKTSRPVTMRLPRDPALGPALRALAKELAALEHPNLVPVFGTAQLDNGRLLLIEGPLHGRNAADYVEARNAAGRPVSVQSALNILAHVVRALGAAGPHGALRPGAVWIADDGTVQLADLAIARAALAQGGTGGLPEHEAAYLAPELKRGQRVVPESDVFGLGALLYVLLTGRSPCEAFVPPSSTQRGVPAGLDELLVRALAAEPSARPATAAEFLRALETLGQTATTARPARGGSGGLEIDVEVSLESTRPSAVASRPGSRPDGFSEPRAGSRISLHEEFRVTLIEDESEAEAARERRSLGEVQLKDVLAKITEDDAPRWMLVKQGMDHGPFSGRQVVNMIVQGGALRDHELLNTDTGRRDKISAFAEFADFLAQYELKRAEEERAQALKQSEVQEKRGAVFKVGIGVAAIAVLGVALGIYALTRSAGNELGRDGSEASDLYKRGALEISGSAGILPIPRGGVRRSGGAPSGAGGLSYEDAMMQAVDIGSATQGGEGTLSAGTVAGVMNKQLGGIFGACVKGSVGQVVVDIAIAGSGQVMGVSVRAGDPGFQRCVADRVRRTRFPSFASPRMGARYSFGT